MTHSLDIALGAAQALVASETLKDPSLTAPERLKAEVDLVANAQFRHRIRVLANSLSSIHLAQKDARLLNRGLRPFRGSGPKAMGGNPSPNPIRRRAILNAVRLANSKEAKTEVEAIDDE